jgi:iron complex outermembrane receptor protein
VHVSLNAYRLRFADEIVLNGQFGPNGIALTNDVGRSIRTGLELGARWRLNAHWELENQSAWSYSRIDDQGESFRPVLTPAWLVNQALRYRAGRWHAALDARYQSASYLDFANTAELPAYWRFDAALGYGRRSWRAELLLFNLADARYYTHGYVDAAGARRLFVQAPRNFSVQVSVYW